MEKQGEPLADLYEQRLKLLERADAGGFWGYHKAEHHFIDLDGAPSSNIFLAAAAQRTQSIRFGPLVYLLPFYHPLRLAEEISALDHLSGGRLEIGVGKGISPPEHRLWGLEPEHAREQFEEAFAIVRAGLAGHTITHAGEHYRFEGVCTHMRPFEERMPGFWYPGNVAYAASHRLSTVVSGPIDFVAQAHGEYRGGLQGATEDWNPGVDTPVFAVKRHLYLAPTTFEARARVARSYPVYHEHLARLWKAYAEPFPNRDPSFGGDMHAATAGGDLVIGTPDEVATHIEALRDRVGIGYFMGAFAWGDLDHAEAMASLELFIDEVMPRFA